MELDWHHTHSPLDVPPGALEQVEQVEKVGQLVHVKNCQLPLDTVQVKAYGPLAVPCYDWSGGEV